MRPVAKEDPPKSPYFKLILSKAPETTGISQKKP